MGQDQDGLETSSGLTATQAEHTEDGLQDGTEESPPESIFQLTVRLPHDPGQIQVMVSTQEQVQDIRQSIVEFLGTFQYTCFHFNHKGKRVNDYVELSDIEGFSTESDLTLVEDPYTEKDARLHLLRMRELLGAAGNKVDPMQGISAGLTLYETLVSNSEQEVNGTTGSGKVAQDPPKSGAASIMDYDFGSRGSLAKLVPSQNPQAPRSVKSLSLSSWNPPPHHLRQRGHLLYLQVTTNEGEQHQITATVSGFHLNKSSNSKFDPFPRPSPKNHSAHSLLTLVSEISPSFDSLFRSMHHFNSQRDPLALFSFSNALPASPWVVPSASSSFSPHQTDLGRTQEGTLMAGLENTESLRDWNEEFQSTRELPKETVQERVFRERLMSKLCADYADAAVRGAMMIVHGEVPPLNPTETKDAQIFVYNNVFFSFGVDGVGTFALDGGDEAARIATGKDVTGVRTVNQLDIDGLFTPATVVVDYLGKRLVGQSIVPGIFKQRAPGEPQIDYGGVDGREQIAEHEAFVPVFQKLSKALKVKKHPVWDKSGKRHDLEGSAETKGLLGTDGRKYVLDLYRITPLDTAWLESHWKGDPAAVKSDSPHSGTGYPHRMTVLRPELIDAYWRLKMREYVSAELAKKQEAKSKATDASTTNGETKESSDAQESGANDASETQAQQKQEQEQERIDVSNFEFTLNPDVFTGPHSTDAEDIEILRQDEAEVRAVCDFLSQRVIPEMVHDLREGNIGHPMDGLSLTRLMHQRGINVRYLGKVVELADHEDHRLKSLCELAKQDMLSRAFKHSLNRHLRDVPLSCSSACIAHLLNCLLGTDLNETPSAQLDEGLVALYSENDFGFTEVTPQTLREDIEAQVSSRYLFNLPSDWIFTIKPAQLLREISLKLGLQLEAKDYTFTKSTLQHSPEPLQPISNGTSNGHSSGSSKKKKKHGDRNSPAPSASSTELNIPYTFTPDNILNIVPVVKESTPRSTLADEALEAGRMSLEQNQKELGQELLIEALSLHEQIYGMLHPEVARFYSQLCMLYYRLEEKSAAVDLARKAVIVSERTLGVDSNETVLSYLNLGLLEHANGNTQDALKLIRHALELWKIVYGPDHPDSITTLNNAAVMLQHLKLYHESRLWFEVSLQTSERIYGKESPHTATLLFQLAQALALDHDSKGAVNRMREAYNIFLQSLGADDKNTKEAESWLDQLTQNAVSIAKHAKDIQTRRLRRLNFTPHVSLGTTPQPHVGQSAQLNGLSSQSASSTQNGMGLDSRSIDELMKFIEGGNEQKRSDARKRHGRNNPKRRGNAAINAIA